MIVATNQDGLVLPFQVHRMVPGAGYSIRDERDI
jgi:hypothetical protein